ncbi:MAG: hypothetical protein OXG11_05655 [Chloroflexi bacterium]|nr:hypothetical protein [Chloroflexota bacterium]
MSAWRLQVALVAVVWLAAALAACGGGSQTANGILTVVRVEERMPDGSMIPVSGARVEFEMYGSRADDSIRRPLYHEFEDTTDENGLSVVFTDPLGRAPTDIGLLLVDVVHPDGRSGFKRAQVEAKFDFAEWSGSAWSEGMEREALIDSVCESAIGFPECESALEAGNLVTWGLGLVIRLKPSS